MLKRHFFLSILSFTCILCTSCRYKADGYNNLYFENLKFESSDSLGYYDGEPYTGPVAKYYNNGQLEFRGTYKNGVKSGYWEYYLEDGKLAKEEFGQSSSGEPYQIKKYRVRNGKLFWTLKGIGKDTIHFIKYHHNGKVGQELINEGTRYFRKWSSKGTLYHYYNEDSIILIYDTKSRSIIHKGHFDKGKRDGFWFKENKDGTKVYERNYKSGFLVGDYKDYHENGNLKIEKSYNDRGIPEGPVKIYHSNGKLYQDGMFDTKGKKVDRWNSYNEYGIRTAVENYLSDYRHGYSEYYNSKGKIMSKGYYKFGKKIGEWSYYDINGKLVKMVKESSDTNSGEST